MTKEFPNTEQSRNLWAPWRMEYIASLDETGPKDGGCFLCRYRDDPASDAEHLVLFRGRESFVVMNRYPYSSGHCLVSPFAHVGELGDLGDAARLEVMRLLCDTQTVLAQTLRCDGFNVGINIGRCAGAGLPGHLHIHIVPRWAGDTNFMSVLGGVRVMPQTLSPMREQILRTAEALGLPTKP
ncbi:MAG: HIT domain-containing protein [Phycisphaerae bacterium]|nr:HIT domain-containing protein [Phycisphaerae bacterium]